MKQKTPGAIPADFDAAVAVVLHRTTGHGDLLSTLLAGWTTLDGRDAVDGDVLRGGTIYVAPAEMHMTVTAGRRIALVRGGLIHHVLSSADPLFTSAALAFGSHCIAVVLTGHDGDGSTGVRAVRREGGTVIAENPETALTGSMPSSAIATGCVDQILDLRDIAPALVQLLDAPI